ncbi:MAG: hypothetical protein KDB75_03975, partial [Flavobacteriales bacterium]|nr:hypothetical protein [Flavobacteriales bacterium]
MPVATTGISTGPLTGGTYDAGHVDANCDNSLPTAARWFVWTAPANGQAQITSCGSGIDTQVSVATGTCGGPWVNVACNDDDAGGCGGYASDTEFFPVTGGTDYYIQWNDGWSTSGFSWDLNFLLPPPPPNGGPDCANAEAVTPGNYTALSPVAGNGASLTCFVSGATHATWYSYLATADGTIDVSACGSGEDTRLSVYDGTCGTLNCLGSGDDNCGLASEVLGIPVINGTTYYIEFDDRWTPGDANWTLTYNAPPPPAPGEDCAAAIGPIGVAVDELSCLPSLITSGTSQDGPAASCSSGSGATPDDDVWISFVAPSNGNKVVITTTGISNTDWVMEVWDDCPGSGTPITCSDDVNGLMPEIELCQFQYTGGNTYYIRAWTWTSGGSGNTMDLCIYEDVACPTPPVNDNCGAATALTLGPDATWCPTNEIPGLTTAATPEGGNGSPSCDSFGTLNDVWYTIATGPTTAAMTVNVNDLSGTQEFAIYEALTCGSGGTVLSCLSTGTSSTVSVMPSSTYYVRVWANPGNEGDFTICAHEVCAPAIATTSPVDDCGNGQFFIDVDISSLGSSASVDIVTDFVGDTEPTGVGTGVTQIGPYPSGTTVIITLVHDNDPGCDAVLPAESYICPPPNDDCVNAIPVACNSVTAGTTTGATGSVEEDNGCGTSDGAPGVWYTVDGYSGLMQARLCGSSYDTKIRVFDGACGGLNCIDGNDDSCGLQSEVSWTGVGGTTYFIQVFGFSGFFGDEVGNFVLEVLCGDQNAPCPDNTAELELNTDDFGSQTSWEIIPVGVPTPVCSGSGYADNDQVFETCCLPDGCYRLRVLYSFGDGMSTGDYVLRDCNGNRIIDNT